jgi:hypothetical protein
MIESADNSLRQGLEGRSFRATLRLYLLSLCALIPIVGVLIAIRGFEFTFRYIPLIVTALVIIQYVVSYAPLDLPSRANPALKCMRVFEWIGTPVMYLTVAIVAVFNRVNSVKIAGRLSRRQLNLQAAIVSSALIIVLAMCLLIIPTTYHAARGSGGF